MTNTPPTGNGPEPNGLLTLTALGSSVSDGYAAALSVGVAS